MQTDRTALTQIQRHPWHAQIGQVYGTRVVIVDGEEKTVAMRKTLRMVCPKCPVRKECRAASVRLAVEETRVIGGAA